MFCENDKIDGARKCIEAIEGNEGWTIYKQRK
jgi:hypothetical protein